MKHKIKTVMIPTEFRQDYININKDVAISAEGNIFKIGDNVCHEGSEIKGEIGTISKFSINTDTNDIIAHTDKGEGRICFMYHSKSTTDET